MNESLDPDIIIFSLVIGTIFFIILAVFFIAFLLAYQKKQHQYQAEKEKLASEFAKALLKTQLEIKEQTLQNISYELHDNLGQLASLIKIHLNLIERKKASNPNETLQEAKELTKQLIVGIKQLSLDLNGNRLTEIGLLTALQEEVERLKKLHLFDIELIHKGEDFTLSKDKMIILYRMSQEILNNIVKHSNANKVLIKLYFIENLLTLVFHDNGLGFNIEDKLSNNGNGLINLQSRAQMIDAEFSMESKLNKGTTVTIKIQL